MCGREKTQEVTRSTIVDEFKVNFQNNFFFSKWNEKGMLGNESKGLKISSELDRKRYE